jgi:nucleolar MIF4G domain-containing protein 1
VEDNTSRKEPTNLLTLLSSLYTFNLVSPVLIYDVIRELLSRLGEVDVELLLRVIQGSTIVGPCHAID